MSCGTGADVHSAPRDTRVPLAPFGGSEDAFESVMYDFVTWREATYRSHGRLWLNSFLATIIGIVVLLSDHLEILTSPFAALVFLGLALCVLMYCAARMFYYFDLSDWIADSFPQEQAKARDFTCVDAAEKQPRFLLRQKLGRYMHRERAVKLAASRKERWQASSRNMIRSLLCPVWMCFSASREISRADSKRLATACLAYGFFWSSVSVMVLYKGARLLMLHAAFGLFIVANVIFWDHRRRTEAMELDLSVAGCDLERI